MENNNVWVKVTLALLLTAGAGEINNSSNTSLSESNKISTLQNLNLNETLNFADHSSPCRAKASEGRGKTS